MDNPDVEMTTADSEAPEPALPQANSSSVADTTSLSTPTPPVSKSKPFRFKYPEAEPAPEGVGDVEWNKIFCAADSRIYSKSGSNANVSRKERASGETYKLALTILETRRREAKAAASTTSTTPAPARPTPISRTPLLNQEPSSSSRDATPSADMMPLSISEQIKSEGRVRKASAAPSSSRGTPAPVAGPSRSSPALAPVLTKVEKPVTKKKGTAAPVKKSKTPKGKKQVKNEAPSTKRANSTPAPNDAETSDDESNDGGEYCICRGPDDHRLMVECEGGCGDWYHCSCVKINEEDARNGLIDRFICPNCKNDTMFTTWRRMCRNQECRKPARVTTEDPSKYCSDECKVTFLTRLVTLARQDDEPSKGGVLNVHEIGSILKQVKTAAELHALGQKPKLPKQDLSDPNHQPGLAHVTPEEAQELTTLKSTRESLSAQITLYQKQYKLHSMMVSRADAANNNASLNVKDICGYDSRIAMNDAEFTLWCATTEGTTALETSILGPRTAETRHIAYVTPYPGQVIAEETETREELKSMCLKARKKCTKHQDWRNTHAGDLRWQMKLLVEKVKAVGDKEKEIVEGAEIREASRKLDEENVVEQLF